MVGRPRCRRVVVLVFATLTASVVATTPTTLASAAPVTCIQDWQLASPPAYLRADGTPTNPSVPLPAAPSPQHRAFHVFCGGRYINTIWLDPQITPLTAYLAARDLVAGARHPTVRLAANPTRGITGLASWFWAVADEGPIRMVPGNGPPIDLELRVQTVRWRFGDGTTGTVSGWGTAFPEPSPVQHVFERKGTFTIEAQVVVVGRFRFEELDFDTPDGGHTVTLEHPVAEIRSLLRATGPGP